MTNIIVLMGPQGAGKGTQAQLLQQRLGLPIVATGDILREVARGDTPLGHQVRELQNAGQLVPDDILADVVSQRTSQDDCRNGYILDGFPRTLPQARLLEQIAQSQGHRVVVISIDVDRDLLHKRLAGRRHCPACNTVYNVYFKLPRLDEVCDLDGTPLAKRDDDTEEAIAKRLALYDEKTRPLLDYYEASGRLRVVSGVGSPDEVAERILEAVRSATAAGEGKHGQQS